MADTSLSRMESALRKQQQALLELVHMQLDSLRESNDSSVATLHLQRRLLALAGALGQRETKTAQPELGNSQPSTH